MTRHTIGTRDWQAIKGLLPKRGPKADNRKFVTAVLWIDRTGAPWRDLPDRLGHWNSPWRRFRRWSGSGVWGRVPAALADPDTATRVLDSTVVRAHPHAAGAGKNRAAVARPPPRRVRTKMHASVTGRGHPRVLKLTPGQAGHAPQAMDVLAGQKRGTVTVVIGDKGYDSDAIAAKVRGLRARVVIPPVARRTKRRRYSKRRYQGRNVVERFWSEVKQCRRVATRFDTLDVCDLAFVHLAAILVVLRHP